MMKDFHCLIILSELKQDKDIIATYILFFKKLSLNFICSFSLVCVCSAERQREILFMKFSLTLQ